jgi:hypothetical protein
LLRNARRSNCAWSVTQPRSDRSDLSGVVERSRGGNTTGQSGLPDDQSAPEKRLARLMQSDETMKTKQLAKLMVLTINIVFLTAFAQAAQDRIQAAMSELDNTVKAWDMKKIAPQTAKVLNMDADLVRKAVIEQHATLSSLVCAKLVADKTGEPVAKVLESARAGAWTTVFKKASIAEDAALEQMDTMQQEVAFMTLEMRDQLTSR